MTANAQTVGSGHVTRRIRYRSPVALLTLLVVVIGTAVCPTAGEAAWATSATAKLIGGDEFNGSAGQSPNWHIWSALTGAGGWGNQELQSYTTRPANVSLDGKGDLGITARRGIYTGSDHITAGYTSARLYLTKPVAPYGRIEARIRIPVGQGLFPAFWTLGSDVSYHPWPVCGEIDIMENINSMKIGSGAIHAPTTSGAAYRRIGYMAPAGGLGNSWHTYAINWTTTAITWYLDGAAYYTVTRASLASYQSWVFDESQFLQLDLAVGGIAPGAPNAGTPAVSTMLVDYVRIYSG